MELVLFFFERLYSFQLRYVEKDRLGWSPSKRGKFEVKSFYKVLTSQDGPCSAFCVDNNLKKIFDIGESVKEECCGG
jgi:hypothetical protein